MPRKASEESSETNRTDSTINRRNYLKMASGAGTTLGTGFGASAFGSEFTTPARAATAVVDDFSNTNLSGRYVFDSRGATTSVTSVSSAVTSGADTNVLQMEGNGTTRMHAYKGDGDTDLNAYPENGDTFSCWLRGLNGTENMNFMYGVQDKDNKYYVKLNLEQGHLGLFKYVDGSGTSLSGDWSNSTIQNTTDWFELDIEWTTDHTHNVTLYQNGSEITSISYTEGSSDPQFTATGVGYSVYLSSGETAQFDYATTTSNSNSGSLPTKIINDGGDESNIIADFEGDLGAFTHDTTRNGRAEATSSPALHGSQALEISDEDAELISLPGDGLTTYPTKGNVISYFVRGSGGADMTNFRYGVKDHKNGYFVRVNIAKGRLALYKLKDGNTTSLDSTSNFSLYQDEWYRVEVRWQTEDTHKVTLYRNDRVNIAQVTETDNTWSNGGVGFDSYLSDEGSSAYFDYVKILCDERPLTSQEIEDAKARCQNSNQHDVIVQKLENEGYTIDSSNITGRYMKWPQYGQEGDILEIPVNGGSGVQMVAFDEDRDGEPEVVAGGNVDSETKFWYYSNQNLQGGSDDQMIAWTYPVNQWGEW